METEDRWYVRFRGHTLGPLTSEQVKASVRGKELGPDDKLASTSNPTWRPLRTQAEFLRCWESLQRPMPVELTPLPSPRILWQKKRSPLPKAPEKAKESAQKTVPVPANEPALRDEPVKIAELPSVAKPAASEARNAATSAARPQKAAPKAKKASASRASAIRAKKTKPKKPAAALASLAGIPEKPLFPQAKPAESVEPTRANPASPAPLPSITGASAHSPTAVPAVNHPKLAEETLSLLAALRDWNRKEQSQAQEIKSPGPVAPPGSYTVPLEPVATSAIQNHSETALSSSAEAGTAVARKIELKLSLTLSKQFIFAFAAVTALALAALIFSFSQAQKMRGPADSRLPDPSSPTANPSAENDPIPQLKAPTRPKRD